jgi:hypothetical protein
MTEEVSVKIVNVESVILMLSQGIDINHRFGLYNILQLCILERNVEVYRYLVNRFGNGCLRLGDSFDNLTITAACVGGNIAMYNEVFGTMSTIDTTIQENSVLDKAVSIVKYLCIENNFGRKSNFFCSIEDYAKLILHVESRLEKFGFGHIKQKSSDLIHDLVKYKHYEEVIELIKIGFSMELDTIEYLIFENMTEKEFKLLKDLYLTGSEKIQWDEIISSIIVCDEILYKFYDGVILDKSDMVFDFITWIQRQIMGPFKLESIVNRAIKDYISNQEPTLLIGEVPKSLIDELHPFDTCSLLCCTIIN